MGCHSRDVRSVLQWKRFHRCECLCSVCFSLFELVLLLLSLLLLLQIKVCSRCKQVFWTPYSIYYTRENACHSITIRMHMCGKGIHVMTTHTYSHTPWTREWKTFCIIIIYVYSSISLSPRMYVLDNFCLLETVLLELSLLPFLLMCLCVSFLCFIVARNAPSTNGTVLKWEYEYFRELLRKIFPGVRTNF